MEALCLLHNQQKCQSISSEEFAADWVFGAYLRMVRNGRFRLVRNLEYRKEDDWVTFREDIKVPIVEMWVGAGRFKESA